MKKCKLTLLLALTVLLSACTNVPADAVPPVETTPDTSAPAASSDELTVRLDAEYTVIRPDRGTSAEVDAAVLVYRTAGERGLRFDIDIDWLNEALGEQPNELEILVGLTNRPESIAAHAQLESEYDYTVRAVGKKIVIVGGCGTATLRAAEYFVELLEAQPCEIEADLCYNGRCEAADMTVHLDGETEVTVTTLYEGVTSTHYKLSDDSKYGQQDITIVEFDPHRSDLYFDVTCGGTSATSLKTVKATAEHFNEANTASGKTALVAVNGDMWMVSYAHARVLGKGTSYGGCSDAVVKKSLTVPRGYNVYDGEIITSPHMVQETPYEGAFIAFGITDDGTALIGEPQVGIKIVNRSTGSVIAADGLNRLPADNALVMYTDRLANNYALDDAYEVTVDCGDYTVRHGETITGRVTAIGPSGESGAAEFGSGRIILTARGDRIERLRELAMGDEVEISVTVTDRYGNSEAWQQIRNAVGGHMPIVRGGRSTGLADTARYPMTILGIKENGNVVMITYDGRQPGYAVGLKNCDADELCLELGISDAFFLDGGGSATMVQLLDGEYKVVNRPSDGSPRQVVNSVILSVGAKREDR